MTTTQRRSEATERATLPGKFVWFEHASADPKRAQRFYGDVLGWKAEEWGDSGYEMILADDTIDSMDSMIGGYTQTDGGRARWLSYVSIDDVDAAARAAEAAGGRVLEAPHDLPGIGRAARIADPQGAELFLFHNDGGDPPDGPLDEPPPARSFFWCELHTTEPDKALAFYRTVVGFTHETQDMGPAGAYHILSASGGGRGGVTGHLPDGTPGPHWLPYVAVDDADATLDRALAAGGKVRVPATDIPGIGRFGVLEDPAGALLAVMKAMPGQS